MLLLTAFLTGLFGSFHCAGMCGPIAFSIPGNRSNGIGYFINRLVYNLSRIITYGVLGFVSGSFGWGLKLAGIQQGLSIAAGLFIVFSMLYTWIARKELVPAFNLYSRPLFKRFFGKGDLLSVSVIGLLNGLLPCGFVYLAVIGASATQNSFEGFLFMLMFGLGTLPVMYGVSILGQFLSQSLRNTLNRLSPVLGIVIGLLFVVRGLNLGVPYLSPKINVEKVSDVECHSPVSQKDSLNAK